MIIKKTHMKDPAKSKVIHLINYLTTGEEALRQDLILIDNCCTDDDIEIATKEISFTQDMNSRCRTEKTAHFIFSFPYQEKPDLKAIEGMIKEFKKKMGYEHAQSIAVGHNDTDNYHFHLVVSRIDKDTYKAYSEPIRDYKIMADCCDEFEKLYQLKSDSYIVADKATLENLTTWAELHNELAKHGASYVKTKSGAVLKRGGKVTKCSMLSKSFSLTELEKRLGEFEPPILQDLSHKHKKNEFAVINSIAPLENRIDKGKILAAKTWEEFHKVLAASGIEYKLKGAGAVLVGGEQSVKASALDRAFSLANLQKKFGKFETADIAKKDFIVKPEFKTDLMDKFTTYKANTKPKSGKVLSWLDWLKAEMMNGNLTAKEYFDKRSHGKAWKYNSIETSLKLAPSKITNRGTQIFSKNVRYGDGKVQFADEVTRYELANVLKNMDTAHTLRISGSEKFKVKLIKEAIFNNIELKTNDGEFNAMYQSIKYDIDKKRESRTYIENNEAKTLPNALYDKQFDRYYINKKVETVVTDEPERTTVKDIVNNNDRLM